MMGGTIHRTMRVRGLGGMMKIRVKQVGRDSEERCSRELMFSVRCEC